MCPNVQLNILTGIQMSMTGNDDDIGDTVVLDVLKAKCYDPNLSARMNCTHTHCGWFNGTA